jgi:hypothetical protein
MKNVLTRMILGPVIPNRPDEQEGLTFKKSQALKLKGSQSGEPGEAKPPISENPTNDPQPS